MERRFSQAVARQLSVTIASRLFDAPVGHHVLQQVIRPMRSGAIGVMLELSRGVITSRVSAQTFPRDRRMHLGSRRFHLVKKEQP